MTPDPVAQFRDALQRRSIIPPVEIIGDGKLRRCDADGRNGKDDAAYLLHLDGVPAGGFENHKDGVGWESWRADVGRKLSFAELEAQRARIEGARRAREAAQEEERANASIRAGKIWNVAPPASDVHPYLVRKGVKAHRLRLRERRLVVPMRDVDGALHSLQFIGEDGAKRFLTGGRVSGCHFSIGAPGDRICVVEGYATGASVHEATGYAVAVAFDCGNLRAVAEAIKAKHPAATLILCADDDYRTDGNPGIAKATEAALAVGGLLAIPAFGPDRPDGATDFNDLAQQRGAEAVKRAIGNAKAPDVAKGQANADRATEGVLEGPPWPDPMDKAAMHGIAGEFVRMVEPNTEADPAAITIQFLVAFGALVGRGPHYRVEGDQHHTNLNALLVGSTGKGRKGTSWGRARQPFEYITGTGAGDGWKSHVSGLSSGEGLKYNVRDAREKSKESGGVLVTEVVDEGVLDKRLLVVESEFASALRNAQKPGNTLSATIREAWDSGTLRTLTKNDPITATATHICIIGHITADELRAELTATDSANGFANRFLFVAVKRSKLLPFGGDQADEGEVRAFAARLREIAQKARSRHQIVMTPGARAAWAKVYPELSAGSDGLHGAVTARAEAQVIRLALVYCLLDGADHIDVPHLLAALAVWQYCDATAKHVFGVSLGDRAADEIMRRLSLAGDAGMTRTEISGIFKRNLTADRIGAALELLRGKGRATIEMASTDGRPTELWRAVK